MLICIQIQLLIKVSHNHFYKVILRIQEDSKALRTINSQTIEIIILEQIKGMKKA